MGDMADFFAERNGGYYGDDDQPRGVRCNRCGKDGLHWEGEEGAWVLCEKGHSVHKCAAKKLHKEIAKDFDNLERKSQRFRQSRRGTK